MVIKIIKRQDFSINNIKQKNNLVLHIIISKRSNIYEYIGLSAKIFSTFLTIFSKTIEGNGVKQNMLSVLKFNIEEHLTRSIAFIYKILMYIKPIFEYKAFQTLFYNST